MKTFEELQPGDKLYFSSKVEDGEFGDIESETIKKIRKKKSRLEILTIEDNYYPIEEYEWDQSLLYKAGEVIDVVVATYEMKNQLISMKR